MNAAITIGTHFTIPAWKAHGTGERTPYATVTRIVGDTVRYRLHGDSPWKPDRTRSLALLQQYAEVWA
jgi:hypothetical protein